MVGVQDMNKVTVTSTDKALSMYLKEAETGERKRSSGSSAGSDGSRLAIAMMSSNTPLYSGRGQEQGLGSQEALHPNATK